MTDLSGYCGDEAWASTWVLLIGATEVGRMIQQKIMHSPGLGLSRDRVRSPRTRSQAGVRTSYASARSECCRRSSNESRLTK